MPMAARERTSPCRRWRFGERVRNGGVADTGVAPVAPTARVAAGDGARAVVALAGG